MGLIYQSRYEHMPFKRMARKCSAALRFTLCNDLWENFEVFQLLGVKTGNF